MSQSRALSADEVRDLRAELDGGATPTVWFTSSAVGVQEGRSGKVIALDDPAEGDFIQVRPAGSKDVLSFSAAEVTLVKPPRKRAQPEKTNTVTARPKPPENRQPATPASAPAKSARAGAEAKAKSAGSTPKPSEPKTGEANQRRKPRLSAGATVILTADQQGQWTVEVSTGKKRVLRPRPVPAASVAQAAKALHEDVAGAVEPLLDAARSQQRSRVEQLQQELADAQRMLDELG